MPTITAYDIRSDKNGAVSYSPKKTYSLSFSLLADTEVAAAIPSGSVTVLVVPQPGVWVYFEDDDNAAADSIVPPTAGGQEGDQIMLTGARSIDLTQGSTHIHLKANAAAEVNVEFRGAPNA